MTVPSVYFGPAKFDMTGVRAGDETLFQLALAEGGNPVDLTGLTPRAQARPKATDNTHMIEADVQVLDAPGGVLQVRWDGEDVRTLLAGKATFSGVYDLQLGANGADVKTVLAGRFLAEMDVTRDVTP